MAKNVKINLTTREISEVKLVEDSKIIRNWFFQEIKERDSSDLCIWEVLCVSAHVRTVYSEIILLTSEGRWKKQRNWSISYFANIHVAKLT